MKFFFAKIFLLFFFIGSSIANEDIRFININYIVNNSEAGKALNKIIENKGKKITSELNDMGKKIENKKDKHSEELKVVTPSEKTNLQTGMDEIQKSTLQKLMDKFGRK